MINLQLADKEALEQFRQQLRDAIEQVPQRVAEIAMPSPEALKAMTALGVSVSEAGEALLALALAQVLKGNEMSEQQWISVDDRLPDQDGRYLAVIDAQYDIPYDKPEIEIVTYTTTPLEDDGWDMTWYAVYENVDTPLHVTHWLPIPPLPDKAQI